MAGVGTMEGTGYRPPGLAEDTAAGTAYREQDTQAAETETATSPAAGTDVFSELLDTAPATAVDTDSQTILETVRKNHEARQTIAETARQYQYTGESVPANPLPFMEDAAQPQKLPKFDQWFAQNRNNVVNVNITGGGAGAAMPGVMAVPVMGMAAGESPAAKAAAEAKQDRVDATVYKDVMDILGKADPKERGKLIAAELKRSGVDIDPNVIKIIEAKYRLKNFDEEMKSPFDKALEKWFGPKEERELRKAKREQFLQKMKVYAIKAGLVGAGIMTLSNPALFAVVFGGAVAFEAKYKHEMMKGADKKVLEADLRKRQKEFQDQIPDAETQQDYFDAIGFANPKMGELFKVARNRMATRVAMAQRLAGVPETSARF